MLKFSVAFFLSDINPRQLVIINDVFLCVLSAMKQGKLYILEALVYKKTKMNQYLRLLMERNEINIAGSCLRKHTDIYILRPVSVR